MNAEPLQERNLHGVDAPMETPCLLETTSVYVQETGNAVNAQEV